LNARSTECLLVSFREEDSKLGRSLEKRERHISSRGRKRILTTKEPDGGIERRGERKKERKKGPEQVCVRGEGEGAREDHSFPRGSTLLGRNMSSWRKQ